MLFALIFFSLISLLKVLLIGLRAVKAHFVRMTTCYIRFWLKLQYLNFDCRLFYCMIRYFMYDMRCKYEVTYSRLEDDLLFLWKDARAPVMLFYLDYAFNTPFPTITFTLREDRLARAWQRATTLHDKADILKANFTRDGDENAIISWRDRKFAT